MNTVVEKVKGAGRNLALATLVGVGVGAEKIASAQVVVPETFTVDYEELANTGMTAAGVAVGAALVVIGAKWGITFGLRIFGRIARMF